MIPHDYHMHTAYSVDSRASMSDMCRAAIEKGIPEIGFAEHFDLYPEDEAPDWFRLEPWAVDLASCRQEFGDRLAIRAGIEVGEPHLFRQGTRRNAGPLPVRLRARDRCTGSGAVTPSAATFSPGRPKKIFRMYFDELREMVLPGRLRHPGSPRRAGHGSAPKCTAVTTRALSSR